MKVMKVQIPNLIKNVMLTAPLLLATQGVVAQTGLQKDVFEKEPKCKRELIEDPNAVSPMIRIAGKKVYPALVVDLSEKQLYHYDLSGDLVDVYPVDFIEDKIKTGINLVDVTKHNYGNGKVAEKFYLTPVNRLNGRIADAPTQTIVGSKNADNNEKVRYTNVITINNEQAKKITKILKDDQFILIRK